MKPRFALLPAVCAVMLFAAAPAMATPLLGFPGAGAADGPNFLITLNPNGTLTLTNRGGTLPDNIEDTYVGVQNLSLNLILKSVTLTGNFIFGFDGDGSYLFSGEPHTGSIVNYEGTIDGITAKFANLVLFNGPGDVVFNGKIGLLPGQVAVFALEESPGSITGATGNITPVPEPTSLAIFGMVGLGGLALARRKLRRTA